MSKNQITIAKMEIDNSAREATKVVANAVAEASAKLASDAREATRVIACAVSEATKVSDKKSIDDEKPSISSFLYKQVSFYLSIIAVVLGGFIYLTNPTKDNDTALQLQDQRITAQRQTIDDLNLTLQNDTKELKNEVQGLRTEVQVSINQIIELKTIIQERIPVKE